MHSDWEFICHFRGPVVFQEAHERRRGEMRPLKWNDMPETTMNHSGRGIVRLCKRERDEKDGQVEAAVEATAVLSDRSKSPGTLHSLFHHSILPLPPP